MPESAEWLPEIPAVVEEFDRALRGCAEEVVEHARSLHERYAAQNVTTLKGTGWPLRPLFLSRATTEFIGRSLHQAFAALTRDILDHAGDAEWLWNAIPLEPRLFESLAFAESLESDSFLSLIRPDGFLYPGRFVLTEVNFGNGTIVSNSYSEVLYDGFQSSPVFRKLGWDVAAHVPRPFLQYIELIRKNLDPAGVDGLPRVALLAHHWEHQVILGWEERVIQAFYYAQRMLRDAGIDSVLVHEDGLEVGEDGVPRVKSDGLPVAAVVQVTIGTSFMDEPERLAPEGDLAYLRGPRVGRVPLIKPLASLCMDKGTMPHFGRLPNLPPEEDGFRLEIARTWFPRSEQAAQYRLNKDRYVLKRAFDGKDTQVGAAAHGRIWNHTLELALDGTEYIMQDYLSLPRTILPVLVDGERLEWIPVRVELSPFVIEGRFAGAIARYAPDAEGLILSPPPEGMGMTLVWCV